MILTDHEEVLNLTEVGTVRNLKKREYLFRNSQNLPFLYIIKKGKALQSYYTGFGKIGQSFLLKEGDVVGSFNHNKSDNCMSVKALTDLEVQVLREYDLQLLSEHNFEAYFNLLTKINAQSQRLEDLYGKATTYNSDERIKQFILEWTTEEGVLEDNMMRINNYLTHQAIASIIGLSRQIVTTWFNDQERKGLLKYSRNEIVMSIKFR
jgi:CRP/FNR family transcriptional regulator